MDNGPGYSTDDLAEAAAILAKSPTPYAISPSGGRWLRVVFDQDVRPLATAYRSGRLEVPALAYSVLLRRLRREIRDKEEGQRECRQVSPHTPPA